VYPTHIEPLSHNVWLLPRDVMHCADYAVTRCLSVRLSHAGTLSMSQCIVQSLCNGWASKVAQKKPAVAKAGQIHYLYTFTTNLVFWSCWSAANSDIVLYMSNGVIVQQIFKPNILICKNDKNNSDTYVLLKHVKN